MKRGFLVGFALVALALMTALPGYGANEPPPAGFSLIPKSFQRRPQLDFNIFTEMTDEGRKLAPPTPSNPAYYVQQAGAWVTTGSARPGNQNPPSVANLEAAMQKALAANGYAPAQPPERPPTLVIIFTYGTHAMDVPVPPDLERDDVPRPQNAEELLPIVLNNGTLYGDLVERAALIAGSRFAAEFKQALAKEVENINLNNASSGVHDPNTFRAMKIAPVSPDLASPYQMFASRNPMTSYIVETAFQTCYFVVASAYDHVAMAKGEKRLLWRTKMTVDALGVSLQESLLPMIATSAPYLGRDMSEVTVVSQQISREGKVEIGEAKVVEGDVRLPEPRQPPASK